MTDVETYKMKTYFSIWVNFYFHSLLHVLYYAIQRVETVYVVFLIKKKNYNIGQKLQGFLRVLLFLRTESIRIQTKFYFARNHTFRGSRVKMREFVHFFLDFYFYLS